MNTLTDIRKRLGLTNQQLADYLGISYSLLTMCQSNKRSLPTKANLQLVRLAIALQHLPVLPTTAPNITETNTALNEQINTLKLQLHTAQKKLTQMTKLYRQATTQLQVVQALTAQPPSNNAAPKEQLWLAALAAEANATLQQNTSSKQLLLQAQIHNLQYYIAELEKLKQ